MDILLTNCRDRERISENIRGLQLSHQTVSRRLDDFGAEIDNKIKKKIQSANAISICLDETTDLHDNSQLITWVRFVDENLNFFDEILDLQILSETTRGVDIFNSLKSTMTDYQIDFSKITAVTTDGAAAMTGYKSGLMSYIKKENPKIAFFRCIIHQESLLAKLGISSAKPMADQVMSIINKVISGGALKHRLFRKFLNENGAPISDLTKMQQVRWLSCRKVFNDFILILPEIREFAKENKINLDHMHDDIWLSDLAFFTDLTDHFAELNLKLQGI